MQGPSFTRAPGIGCVIPHHSLRILRKGQPDGISQSQVYAAGAVSIGRKHWAIAEGWIPLYSHGPEPAMISHETACLLNTNDTEAHVEIMIYFSDRHPVGPYKVTVPPKRTLHLRFNNLKDPAPIPRGTDYSSTIDSDVPIVVQHTRLDSRQSENALLTTIAFSGNE